MLKPLDKGAYMCINCGYSNNPTLVRVHGKDGREGKNPFKDDNCNPLSIRLSTCEECDKPVDDSWTHDGCILIINAILLKESFFRHIISNCEKPASLSVKLFMVYSFCDTYQNWSRLTRKSGLEYSYVELESLFYHMFFQAMVTNALFYSIISLLFRNSFFRVGSYKFISSLILCSYSKFYKLPMTLWPSELQALIDLFLQFNLLWSLIECCHVLNQNRSNRFNIGFRITFAFVITNVIMNVVSAFRPFR
ncbi:protein ARV1-like [Brevipalpus obovatus]|uniref:protein ARV1-like n=1 Tax=Brevipalpus obovatus TaxID=246614 RepID=UPI003D9E6B35